MWILNWYFECTRSCICHCLHCNYLHSCSHQGLRCTLQVFCCPIVTVYLLSEYLCSRLYTLWCVLEISYMEFSHYCIDIIIYIVPQYNNQNNGYLSKLQRNDCLVCYISWRGKSKNFPLDFWKDHRNMNGIWWHIMKLSLGF